MLTHLIIWVASRPLFSSFSYAYQVSNIRYLGELVRSRRMHLSRKENTNARNYRNSKLAYAKDEAWSPRDLRVQPGCNEISYVNALRARAVHADMFMLILQSVYGRKLSPPQQIRSSAFYLRIY